MYYYRNLTPEQQHEIIQYRRQQQRPWHSPPHWDYVGELQFILSAACFEHAPIIGVSHQRLTEWEEKLLEACEQYASETYAWCILPNHYHLLIKTDDVKALRKALGKLHGRTSYEWNGVDKQRGRQVWHNCFERPIKSERHFWATVNYIHYNPVKHGYVDKWQGWQWSSANEFLGRVGHETAIKIWHDYPILDYGEKWDVEPDICSEYRL